MLIDTHCHINDLEAFPDPSEAIARALEAGVTRMIAVGVKPDEWERTVELSEAHPSAFCILGWHPNYCADYDRSVLDLLKGLLERPKVLALGEIGLDYHWDFAPRDKQYEALHAQLDLAAEMNVPVVFHAREAYSDLLTVLEGRPVRPYLFHCFGGSANEAERVKRLDGAIGVDGPVTYPKATELREILATFPRNRVVLETDSPYLTPVPFRGKPNEPAYTVHIANAVAKVWDTSLDEVARTTTENAIRFFGEWLA